MDDIRASPPVDSSTPSLTLRRLTLDDVSAFEDLMLGPGAAPLRERMGWSDQLSTETVRNYVQGYVRAGKQNECASYLVRERGTDRAIGAGFLYREDGAELGLWLHPDYWGSGYGTEILDALTAIAVDSDIGFVWAETDADNVRAISLLSNWVRRYGGTDETVTDGSLKRRFAIDRS